MSQRDRDFERLAWSWTHPRLAAILHLLAPLRCWAIGHDLRYDSHGDAFCFSCEWEEMNES